MVQTRALGWVQNPSDFDKLKLTVQIFDNLSNHHHSLKNILLDAKVHNPEVCETLKEALNRDPLILKYSELVGTGTSDRKQAKCDALIQASIKDQGNKKGYIDNWSSDGFLRWAECLDFVNYNRSNDTFSITEIGLAFSRSNNKQRDKILIERMLAYPPATRILELLDNNMREYSLEGRTPDNNMLMTKFEIGSSLGFAGENGFTSLPENQIVEALHFEKNRRMKNKIRSDWEGSSDKYTRMISRWLVKLKLVQQTRKFFYFDDSSESEYISHAFRITPLGSRYLRNSKGNSRHPQISKYVSWEMLATNVKNRDYIRTRRGYILVYLKDNKSISLTDIVQKLREIGFTDPEEVIVEDIKGLMNCGLIIEYNTDAKTFHLLDQIYGLFIPEINLTDELTDKRLQQQKADLSITLPNINKKYIELIEIAFDSKQNRVLEMQVMELLREEYDLFSKHLGGSRKPDGISYSLDNKYGIIVDTKAYSKGYSLPISQADEMRRYVQENTKRDPKLNDNEWWKIFPDELSTYYFLFVTGKFVGSFEDKLDNIYHSTKVKGGGINIEELLYGANAIKENALSLTEFPGYFDNKEIIFSS